MTFVDGSSRRSDDLLDEAYYDIPRGRRSNRSYRAIDDLLVDTDGKLTPILSSDLHGSCAEKHEYILS